MQSQPERLPNRTRVSHSIPRRLWGEGKLHLIPVYALLRTSDLAREGIENSGSFRFADHIYRGKASGRYGVGTVLDSVLLKLRGARSMRSRFFHSQREIHAAIKATPARSAERGTATEPFTVVSVPCGIARDLYEVAETLCEQRPVDYERIRFIGIDLDQKPVELSRELTRDHFNFTFVQGDALDPATLPTRVDAIVSLGFGEFLSDDVLVGFYRSCYAALREGGRFITSAMNRDRIGDYLARELAELHTNYRSAEQLTGLLQAAGFEYVKVDRDDVGLQTLAVATKAKRELTEGK
ncbi:MAG TPA: class I SAM-dependent methyltransferase [Gemmatimonadaceae bacterium]|nr:class I SAM-dependent methyltransferase [Gemmatimonadaceae bacterium]